MIRRMDQISAVRCSRRDCCRNRDQRVFAGVEADTTKHASIRGDGRDGATPNRLDENSDGA